MKVVGLGGVEVVLSAERWRHIVFRHPELTGKQRLVLHAVSGPDETYVDASLAVHVLKRLVGEASDFLVVIYSVEGERGYIRTAYYTSNVEKQGGTGCSES